MHCIFHRSSDEGNSKFSLPWDYLKPTQVCGVIIINKIRCFAIRLEIELQKMLNTPLSDNNEQKSQCNSQLDIPRNNSMISVFPLFTARVSSLVSSSVILPHSSFLVLRVRRLRWIGLQNFSLGQLMAYSVLCLGQYEEFLWKATKLMNFSRASSSSNKNYSLESSHWSYSRTYI